MRRGMKFMMILNLVFAASVIPQYIYFKIFPAPEWTPEACGAAGFFLVMALMFLVLGYSPRGYSGLFGRDASYFGGIGSGFPKVYFVVICVLAGFAAEAALIKLISILPL